MKSWIEVKKDSDFPIQNLPFGIFKTNELLPRVGVAIGDFVLDLAELKKIGVFNSLKLDTNVFARSTLNEFISLGKKTTRAVRARIYKLLEEKNPELRDDKKAKAKVLHKMSEVEMLLPVEIGDYTDFYSSRQHAFNVGSMFRDPANALLPNWKHLPVGYHGRSSSIVVSGTNFHRPKGQINDLGIQNQQSQIHNTKSIIPNPILTPTRSLDFELEMAFIIGKETKLGESISIKDAEDFIFGIVLFNDWSARDIQSWEYVPLGPFLGKNFCSSVSPWVVTTDALEPFRIAGPKQEPQVLSYLQSYEKNNYDAHLEVFIQPEGQKETLVSKSNLKYMYWNMCQQLAHHTVNGCNVRIGDIMASGTISGPTPDSFGSMLELTWKGTKPILLPDGTERKFLNDNDTVIMRGYGEKNGLRIGFGEVKGKILPAVV